MNNTLEQLRQANPKLDIRLITDESFKRYGYVLSNYDPSTVIERAIAAKVSSETVEYEPSVAELEAPCKFNQTMQEQIYGGMPVQVGRCYGQNNQLGALEYHKGTEIDVCVTDLILLVGNALDIKAGSDFSYDTSLVKAFYAPAGTVVELPAWNLHYAPIQVKADEGFCALVYLPTGTNTDLPFEPEKEGEAKMLFAVNKWLLAHPDDKALAKSGAYPGLTGENTIVNRI